MRVFVGMDAQLEHLVRFFTFRGTCEELVWLDGRDDHGQEFD